MVLMQMRLIVFALSAASSLTLTAASSMPAPPQAQEQRSVDAKDEDARSTSKSFDTAREIKTEKPKGAGDLPGVYRSEEHTSELQSLTKIVCRLLLEKKKARATTLAKRRSVKAEWTGVMELVVG